MKKLNKVVVLLVVAIFCMAALIACAQKAKSAEKAGNQTENSQQGTEQKKSVDGKINVVATIFPEYDFLRQIGGNHLNLTMLLTPGAESHSFEPTPQDIKEVTNSNLFVYVGGDSDAWVDSILDSVDTKKTTIVTLMDCVTLKEEEVAEGMTPEKEDEAETESGTEGGAKAPEYDEHVWTSPKNAVLIVQKLCDNLCKIDPSNAPDYKQNTKNYVAKLNELDGQFQNIVDHAQRKEIVVGDRFPFRYFVDAYGLTYHAAFPGCSTDTEANAATIAFLTDKVKKDKIPIVFHIELSNEKVCDSICEATGAKSELLNAVHNVSKKDFEAGITYIDLMEHNVDVLKEALN